MSDDNIDDDYDIENDVGIENDEDIEEPEVQPLPSENTRPWDQAREYFSALGKISPSFSTPIRTLLVDQRQSGILSPASQFLTTRLLRSPTIKAIFYYLTLTLHGGRIQNSPYLSSADLLRLYSPSEIASIICLIYLYKRTTKAANLASDEDWLDLTKTAIERIEVGGHFGYAVPEIGATKGLLAGGFREISLGIFALHDLRGFKVYRHYLLTNNLSFDVDFEMRQWGCSHLEIAGNVLQLMGVGIPLAHSLMIGLGRSKVRDNDKDRADAYEFMVVEEWINSLIRNNAPPDKVHKGQYYPSEMAMHKLLYQVNGVRENGSRYMWLQKGKEDINPNDTPQLYQEFLLELQGSKALEEFYQENLPAEVLDLLSEEDMKELAGIPAEDTKG